MKRSTWRLLAALLFVFAMVAAACGGDDDETSGSTDQTTTTAADDGGDAGDDEGEQAAGDVEEYCAKTLEIETIPEPEIDFESLSPEEQAEAAKQFATDELQPLAQDIQAAAPEEISDDIALLVGAVDEIAETGDFAAFEDPEVDAASDRVHEFDLENCGWSQVDVTAEDYAFQGLGDTLEAGPTSFEFANEGAEFHELVIVRKNDDTTESAEELLSLPEEEAMAKVSVVGATFAPPGEGDSLVTDLEAGDYIAVCFVPVGSTPQNEEADGPPHFTEGMVSEFSVE